MYSFSFFFFQAEDGIRDSSVTGVQTCALPILESGSICTSSKHLSKWPAAMRASFLSFAETYANQSPVNASRESSCTEAADCTHVRFQSLARTPLSWRFPSAATLSHRRVRSWERSSISIRAPSDRRTDRIGIRLTIAASKENTVNCAASVPNLVSPRPGKTWLTRTTVAGIESRFAVGPPAT